MENKNLIIICVIVVIIAILGYAFVTGAFNQKEVVPTTPFETDFMSGAFVGSNVERMEVNNSSYLASFRDTEHNITYNMTTMDNSSALMEIYHFQGVKGPEYRTFNGQQWEIYFAEAMPVVNNTTSTDSSQRMGIIICHCQQESQGYVIYSIFDVSKVNFTMNTYGDAYLNYIEPLLNSVNLKQSDNVPAVNEQFGLSQEDFQKQIDIIRQVEAGNRSALQG